MPYGQRNRAFRTLPEEFTIMKSSIPRAGRGVWTKKDIPECVFIGPYGGEKVYNRDLSTLDYAWRVIKADTVLPAKCDSDIMFCLQCYKGVIIDGSLVY